MRILLLAFFSVLLPSLIMANRQNEHEHMKEGRILPMPSYMSALFQDPPANDLRFSIYPNPASEYIQVSNEEGVSRLVVFNLVGRELRTFEVHKGEKYFVGDLPRGMYLIQAVGVNKNETATQRLQIR